MQLYTQNLYQEKMMAYQHVLRYVVLWLAQSGLLTSRILDNSGGCRIRKGAAGLYDHSFNLV
jgi:hypothetical protein